MLTIPRHLAAAIVAALLVLVGALVWSALPESCASWHDRYTEALADSIYGDWSDRKAAAIVKSERPEGCR